MVLILWCIQNIHGFFLNLISDQILFPQFGPRALGHRSMLCYPNRTELKEKLNKYVITFRKHSRNNCLFCFSLLSKPQLIKHPCDEKQLFALLFSDTRGLYFRLKGREWFRPLCPSIAIESVPKLFHSQLKENSGKLIFFKAHSH